jgi:predicted nucleic acid-binding protein
MSDRCFLDTNILVYAHDNAAGWKHERAATLTEQLWNQGTGLISTQVLQEFCYTVRRKLPRPLSLEETFAVVQQYVAWNVVINSPTSVLEAIEIEARHRVSFWDALILNAAGRGGATILYTEDFSHGQFYGDVRVVNPFADRSR